MSDKIRFGKKEAISMLVISMTTQLLHGFNRRMAVAGGTAGWIVPIYTAVLALVVFFIIAKLYSSFEGKDIIDIAQIAGGNIGRILVGIIFILNYTFAVLIVLRTFGEYLKTISLAESPISFIILFFIVGMVIALYCGIEAIGRLSAIVASMIVLGSIIIVLGNAKFFRATNLLPVLGSGPYEIFIKGIPKISIFSANSILFFMAPFIGKNKDFKRVGYLGILFSAILLTVGVVTYSLVVPYPASIGYMLPSFHLARSIEYGRFFQRIESIFVLAWSLVALIYSSLGLFFTVYVIKKTFRLEYYRPLIMPLAIIVFAFSLMLPDLVYAVDLEVRIFRRFGGVIAYGIPIAVLLLARLVKRKKEGGKKNEKNF